MTTSLQFYNPELLWLLAVLPVLMLLRGRSGRNAAMVFSSVALARTVSGRTKTRAGALLFFLRLGVRSEECWSYQPLAILSTE